MNFLLSLFSTNKLAFYSILSAVILVFLTTICAYSYHKGVVNTENKLASEYSKLLEEKIATNNAIMDREFKERTNSIESNNKIKTVYVERKQKIEKSSNPNSVFQRKECDLTDEDLKEINENTSKP